MEKDESFGVIPLRRKLGHYELFLVCHKSGGHWSFPKGHRSSVKESFKEIARRELKEETDLEVKRFLSEKTFQEIYIFEKEGKKIQKKVIYYLAEAEGVFKPQEVEIIDGGWFEIEEALNKVTFKESKRIIEEVNIFLQEENI